MNKILIALCALLTLTSTQVVKAISSDNTSTSSKMSSAGASGEKDEVQTKLYYKKWGKPVGKCHRSVPGFPNTCD